MRAFGVAFILAAGSAAGSLIPPVSGALLDRYGLPGVFGLAASMYVVFAISIQFGPETYGKSMEDPNQPADIHGSPGVRAPEPA
jgi:MFS family permease